MKILTTHIRPHLDDICGIWLLARYMPEYRVAALEFIPTNATGGAVKDSAEVTCVGVGRGRYDEHKGDIGECSTTLVWRDVRERAEIAQLERRALERIVEWVRSEDTGRLLTMPLREFSVPLILQGEFDRSNDSAHVTGLGFRILDALLASARNAAHLDDAWQGRIAFTSRFGPAVAARTSVRGFESHAYAQGFDLAVFVSEDGRYHNIRAKAESSVDLTSVYEELKRRDPKAGWYFHHSKKMLICGGQLAPDVTPSSLSLEQLIELVK